MKTRDLNYLVLGVFAAAALATIGLLTVRTPLAHADLSAPSWWSNTDCDTAHNTGAYALGASYNGVKACGPRPIGDNGVDVTVNFFSGAWGEYEWECVELVMRYMYLAYSINPYNAPGGKDVVDNYGGTALTKVSNNGTALPSPGDILSESATVNNAFGHTAVVTAVNVTNGTGTVSMIEQNKSANGAETISVSNGILQDNVSGWLHGGTSGSSGHLRQFYVSGSSWVWADVTAQSNVSIAGDPYEDSNGGLWARDTNNHLRQFYVNNGWQAADITSQSGVSVSGNPFQDSSGGIWARDTNNHLRQFYVSGNWVAADITAQSQVSISSDPNNGSGGLFARDTNNHLRQFYVSGSSWVAADISAQSNVNTAGNPTQGTGGIFSNT